jgi:hypothetical protein
MALDLNPLTIAWTFHAGNPDDDPTNLDGWAATLSTRYESRVRQALEGHQLPVDREHINWAVALAEVSNGVNAAARLSEACRFLSQTEVSDAAFAALDFDAAIPSTARRRRGTADANAIADGRYAGGNHEVAVELRIDAGGCGVISGDLYRISSGARHYVASIRTPPQVRADSAAGEWPVVAQDEAGRIAQGRLWLAPQEQPPASLNGRVQFDTALEGLPSRRAVPFVAERASAQFRTLGLEIEIEEGVNPPAAYTFGGRTVTVEDSLAAAGFETFTSGVRDTIPTRPDGWEMAQLHTLMADLAQTSLQQRSWELHLLLLSNSDRDGLLGVMFDSSDALQRQGCAVFASAIRAIPGINHERKLIQTTVHELGHALNLAHRFERVVGRADSPSFMNYDWRYRGGNRVDEFWNRFQFTFDNDELEFLRHAPLPPVIPGGAPFHSVPYWADGNGGYSPYVPESPLSGWTLEMQLPPSGGLFKFAQPVLLELALTNRTGQPVTVPKFILDPKAGFVEILIRRVNAGAFAPGGGQSLSFVPAMQRCFEWDSAETLVLGDGEKMSDNVNLTFGSAGFAFAEPGTYDVTALLVLFNQQLQREFIAKSQTVRIRVAAPRNDDEEHDAMDFFSDEVGLYLALGGSKALSGARDRLAKIAARRKDDTKDPLVAHITRAFAIDESRAYVRYRNGKFATDAPDLGKAVKLVGTLGSDMPAFDAATKHATNELADRWRTQLRGGNARSGPVAPRVATAVRKSGGRSAKRQPRKR